MDLNLRRRRNEQFFADLIKRRPQDRTAYMSMLGTLESVILASADAGQSTRERALETIVSRERPVLFVREGRVDVDDLETDIGAEARELVSGLSGAKAHIDPLLSLIGRIDVDNFPNGLPYVGTGWFVADDVVVTNRHVAGLIARWDGRRFAFIPGMRGADLRPTLNSGHWAAGGMPEAPRHVIEEVLYIEPENGPNDIAFVRVKRALATEGPRSIGVAQNDIEPEQRVCVVGYPARAPRQVIHDQALMEQLYRGRYDVKRVAPGLSMRTVKGEAQHDCTTLGGNSGSVVLSLATGEAVGLHFAGLYQQANYSVPASVLRDYVSRRRWTAPVSVETGAVHAGAAPQQPLQTAQGSPSLAARFSRHLEQDFTRSAELRENGVEDSGDDVMVEIPLNAEGVALERPAPERILAPLVTKRRRIKARYLLTPDREGAVFSRAVLDLINSAERQLLFQIPYIGMPASPDGGRGFIDDLIQALTRKLNTLRDARVLLRRSGTNLSDPRHAAWYFKSKNVDIDRRVKVIDNHHTKGMVIDGQRVLIGSHNWSAAGVTLNRDASLIFDDREIAQYYAEAFEIDWLRASAITPKKNARAENVMLADTAEDLRPGYRRIALADLEID